MPSASDTAQQLRDLAGRQNLVTVRDRLERIAACLEGRNNEEWAELDLHREIVIVEPSDLVAGSADEVVIKRLDVARTALIFMPIAITWLGIALAARAYGAAIGASPDLRTEPFIALWERGFDGFGGWSLSLFALGLIDFALIATLIAVTYIVGSKRTSVETTRLVTFEADRAALDASLTDAQLLLAGRRLASPVRFQQELTATASGLRDVFTSIDDLVQVNSDQSALSQKAAAALRGAVVDLRDVLAKLERSTSEVGQTVTNLSDSTERVSERIDRAASATVAAAQRQGSTSDILQRVSGALESATASLGKSSEELAVASAAAAEERAELAEHVKGERLQYKRLSTSMNKTLSGLEAMTTELGALTGHLAGAATNIESAGARFSASTASMSDIPSHLAATTEGLDAVLGTHTELAQLMRQAAGTLAVSVDHVRSEMERLDSLLQSVAHRADEAIQLARQRIEPMDAASTNGGV